MHDLKEPCPSALFIIGGVSVTLKYSIISVFLGFFIGSFLALFKTSHIRFLVLFADGYTSIFRGTPLLIQLSTIYFAIPQILAIKIPILFAGIIAFSLNSGAYVSEIIRAGINAVDKGQFEAATALGIPSLINELINIVKESAIISFLGEEDLIRRATMVAQEQFDFFTPMLISAFCYYLIVLMLARLAKIVENRMAL
mgnify:CR=1 FL=1